MAVIQNFGFMWEREKIKWAAKGPGGGVKFSGVKVGDRHKRVSFVGQMGIYVLYDKFEQPVQVGQAQNILTRLNQHRKDHLRNRWTFFTWFGFYGVGANNSLLLKEKAKDLKRVATLGDSLHEIEAVLIQVLEPRLNRRGANWNDSEEYLQVDETLAAGQKDDISDEE